MFALLFGGCDESLPVAESPDARVAAGLNRGSAVGPSKAVDQEPATRQNRPSAASVGSRAVPDAPVRERDISFDDVGFKMKKEEPFKRSMLTPKIEKLDHARIRIRGYMLPSFQQHGITQFVLVRDNQECCFGPGAALYDCIVVEMQGGNSVDYTIRPVAVEGTFTIRELTDPDGKHLAIYHLDGERVK